MYFLKNIGLMSLLSLPLMGAAVVESPPYIVEIHCPDPSVLQKNDAGIINSSSTGNAGKLSEYPMTSIRGRPFDGEVGGYKHIIAYGADDNYLLRCLYGATEEGKKGGELIGHYNGERLKNCRIVGEDPSKHQQNVETYYVACEAEAK